METLQALIADLEVRPVARIAPDASLADAARVVAETDGGAVIVDTIPITEVTEHDIVGALARGAMPDTPICECAHAAPDFVRPDTTAEDAAMIMIVSGRGDLIVVDEGRPIGIIRLHTVASALWGASSWLGALRVALHVEGR
jgi:CBS domain-containing protein